MCVCVCLFFVGWLHRVTIYYVQNIIIYFSSTILSHTYTHNGHDGTACVRMPATAFCGTTGTHMSLFSGEPPLPLPVHRSPTRLSHGPLASCHRRRRRSLTRADKPSLNNVAVLTRVPISDLVFSRVTSRPRYLPGNRKTYDISPTTCVSELRETVQNALYKWVFAVGRTPTVLSSLLIDDVVRYCQDRGSFKTRQLNVTSDLTLICLYCMNNTRYNCIRPNRRENSTL